MKLLLSFLIASGALAGHTERPKQGVFLNSNQPNNQVGVYESLEDGSLAWVGRYDTGGIGYPDPLDERNQDDLGSSNAVHYHAWDNKQWLLAANAGGPGGEASMTLFEVQPDLELVKKDRVDLQGTFACTVTGHGNRACAMGCAFNVTMECFRITEEGTLEPEFKHNFEEGLEAPENRTNRVSAGEGPGNILFSPDGTQVGVVMKGDRDAETLHEAGFFSFPVMDRGSLNPSGYGAPTFFPLPDEILPFATTYSPGPNDDQIALISNIAGQSMNSPECGETDSCYSSIISLKTQNSGEKIVIEQVNDLPLNVIDACWIEYRGGHFYTGNFISDSISVGTVGLDGTLAFERNVPIGVDTVPNDLASVGQKFDGTVYLYTENQGTGRNVGEIGVHELLEDGMLRVLVGAPIPTGETQDSWAGNNGLAATTLSEEELFALYDYDDKSSPDTSSSRVWTVFVGALSAFLAFFLLI